MLDFTGKGSVYAHHRTVPIRPFVTDKSKSTNPVEDDNLIIHGDNLHALKALLPHYAGRVNCIYIDPPYNTGNEKWKYNDNVSDPKMQEWFKEQREVDGEDLERHDKWMCMMWPRLQLLKELLADDGVIFISIDYNEQHHLRAIMDEIFGEKNFRNMFAVARIKKNIKEREEVRKLNNGFNLVVFYGKSNKSSIIPPKKSQKKPARWHGFDAPELRDNESYSLFGRVPPSGRHWMYVEERAKEMIAQGRLRANPETGTPEYLLDEGTHTMLDTNWTDVIESASKFDLPNGEKNVKLIKRIISMITNKNAIVLDSFAGSGTTAHAVLELNKEDGGGRKFILVEFEDYVDTIITRRVRDVIKTQQTRKKGLVGSFTYCTLGEPLNIDEMLTGKSLPDYSVLASHLLYTTAGISVNKKLRPKNKDGLFYTMDGIDYYLLYKPDPAYLQSNKPMLNNERAKRISNSGKMAVVFGPGKHMGQRELTRMKIEFCLIPDRIQQA